MSKRGHVNSLFACTPILLLSRVQDIITMSVDPKRRDDYTSTDVVLRRRVYIFNQSKHGVVLAAYSDDVVVIRLVITLTTLRHGYCVRSGDGGAGRGRGGGGGDGAGAGTDRCPKGGT